MKIPILMSFFVLLFAAISFADPTEITSVQRVVQSKSYILIELPLGVNVESIYPGFGQNLGWKQYWRYQSLDFVKKALKTPRSHVTGTMMKGNEKISLTREELLKLLDKASLKTVSTAPPLASSGKIRTEKVIPSDNPLQQLLGKCNSVRDPFSSAHINKYTLLKTAAFKLKPILEAIKNNPRIMAELKRCKA